MQPTSTTSASWQGTRNAQDGDLVAHEPAQLNDTIKLLTAKSFQPTRVHHESIPMEPATTLISASRGWLPLWSSWKWDCGALFLSLASLTSMLGTLLPYQNAPLPQWPLQISVNTLLSVYAVVLKSTLLFVLASCLGQLQWTWFSSRRPLYDLVRYDEAVRGPWGAVRLVASRPTREPLTLLGAFIVVNTVAIGPVFQQLIRLVDCTSTYTSDNQIASLPRTNVWNSRSNLEPIDGPLAPNRDLTPVVLSGVFSRRSDIQPTCPTGNCTFQAFATLGFCSRCEDSSADVRIDKTDHVIFQRCTGVSDAPAIPCYMEWERSTNITSSLPSGLSTTFSVTNTSSTGIQGNMSFCALAFSAPAPDDFMESQLSMQLLVGETVWLEAGYDAFTGRPRQVSDCNAQPWSSSCRGYGAVTCRLQACVRIFNASVKAGRFHEELIEESGLAPWGGGNGNPFSSLVGILDGHCASPEEKKLLIQRGYVNNDMARWLPVNTSRDETDGYTQKLDDVGTGLVDRGCLYLFDNIFTKDDLSQALKPLLTGSLNVSGYGGSSGGVQTVGDLSGPIILKHIYNYGRTDLKRVQDVFSNISDALTDLFRRNGDPEHSKPAIGQIEHYAICLQVRWQWIIFPAVLVILTYALFVMTVTSTNRDQLPIWKSSILPWIFRGPTAGQGERTYGEPALGTVDEMAEEAKHILISLVKGPSGPHVDRVEVNPGDSSAVGVTRGGVSACANNESHVKEP